MKKHLAILTVLAALLGVWQTQSEIQAARVHRHTVLARLHAPSQTAARADAAFEELGQALH